MILVLTLRIYLIPNDARGVSFFLFSVYLTSLLKRRYKVLCANLVKDSTDPKKATAIILEAINLEPDQYRLGSTKV